MDTSDVQHKKGDGSVPRRIELYDTTLRDGAQGLGFNLSLDDKLRILLKLDFMGLDYVEGGYPLSNPKDAAFFQEASSLPLQRTKLVAFGMTRRKGRRAQDDPGITALVAAGTRVVAVVGKTWDFHVREVLGVGVDENIRMILETISYLRSQGKEVIYDAEHFFDGYKNNPVYAIRTIVTALEAGAKLVCLCDTNGGSLPAEVGLIVNDAVASVGGPQLGIHTHNDCGLGVANALEAVARGVVQVQGTINGVGERCGNADLIVMAANLGLKMGYDVLDGLVSLRKLTELSRFVDGVAGRDRVLGQPYVGPAAFAHKGGMHVHAVQRNAATYEHVPPESVGNERQILVSELSGVSNIRNRVSGIVGLGSVDRETLQGILDGVNRLEKEGYVYESADASFELLVRRILGKERKHFRVSHYQCGVFRVDDRPPVTTGLVSVELNGATGRSTAEGEDPLSALEAALREALKGQFPVLKAVRLVDRRFRAVERPGCRATRVRVTTDFTDAQRNWSTVAVGQNVIDAGLECLVEGFEYYLLRHEQPGVSAQAAGSLSAP